jgi:hypothetical protein
VTLLISIFLFTSDPTVSCRRSVETEQTMYAHLLYKYLRSRFGSGAPGKLGGAMMIGSINRELYDLLFNRRA